MKEFAHRITEHTRSFKNSGIGQGKIGMNIDTRLVTGPKYSNGGKQVIQKYTIERLREKLDSNFICNLLCFLFVCYNKILE